MASPLHPELYTPIHRWLPANWGCYNLFRTWLRRAGYSNSALDIYSCAVRLAISQLDKPYWQITGDDLDRVRAIIVAHYESEATRRGYHKGLLKLAEFLRQRQGQTQPVRELNWAYFLAGLPSWLAADVRAYIRHRQRAWLPETHDERASDLLSHLTRCLRWAVQQNGFHQLADLTPALWFAYVDVRLATGITAATVNGELNVLQPFLTFLAESGRAICTRLLEVERLPAARRLPRDVPLAHLRQLYAAIEAETTRPQRGIQRTGIMDRAWFLLMLHSGLRVGEVRRVRLPDLDLDGQRLRIEQSKGLVDRVVFLSAATVAAIEAYLPLRGPVVEAHLFVYRHRPLTPAYCAQRLRTFGRRCGVTVTPHQLRHSCATLLLNAGAPILTVQALLGHKHIDTTLTYARLYDGTVAADYYRAMAAVEHRLHLGPADAPPLMTPGQMIALVDALTNGTLNGRQRDVLAALRQGLSIWGERTEDPVSSTLDC